LPGDNGRRGALKSEIREYIEALLLAVILAGLIIAFVAQSFLVHGSSMEPTLSDGERLLVDKITYRLRPPERGEIIVFHYPADPKRKFIKRVIGLPGDVIQIRGHQLYLNGVPVEEPYINGPILESFGPVRVPEGHVFVLGDNRNNSDDSRYPDVGPVPMEMIVGVARLVYWPPSRIGLIRVPAVFAALER
jgi:signal peptidase I, bacterial type